MSIAGPADEYRFSMYGARWRASFYQALQKRYGESHRIPVSRP
jgi:hypothetical protein